MKYRIKSLDEVAENLRSLYVADGDEFVLKLDDDPAEGMRSARDHEKNARKEAERKLRELEAKKAEEDDNNKKKKAAGIFPGRSFGGFDPAYLRRPRRVIRVR